MEPLFLNEAPEDPISSDEFPSRNLACAIPASRRQSRRQGKRLVSTLPHPVAVPTSTEARGYEAIDDPGELRIALRELHRVRAWIGQFGDIAAETPGYGPESVRAVKATSAMVSLLIERAEARLRSLPRETSAEVVVLDTERRTLTLETGETSIPQVCTDCDLIMVVRTGTADLFWWDSDGVIHRTVVKPSQPACVRRNTRHCVVNSGTTRFTAVQVQAVAEAGLAGVTPLPDLAAELPAIETPDNNGNAATG